MSAALVEALDAAGEAVGADAVDDAEIDRLGLVALVFETPAELAESEARWIREEMTNAMTLKAPLKVEINWGKNWQEGK